jgi:phosphate transport system permease protein
MNARKIDQIATVCFYIIALFIIGVVISLVGYLLYRGFPHITWDFLTKAPGAYVLDEIGGIAPQLFNSIYLLLLTLCIALPIGICGGIYMAEYAKPNWFTRIVRLCMEVMSSLPSIIIGLFGLLLFVQVTHWGYTLAGGALTLAIFNLPLLVRIVEQAIRTVPPEQKEASLSLGISHWQTICNVMLPIALPGIVTGIILAAGRIFGEAAALLFTAGMSSPNLDFTNWDVTSPSSPLNPFRPAATLSVYIWKVNTDSLSAETATIVSAGASCILICVVFVSTIVARLLGRYLYRRLTSSTT